MSQYHPNKVAITTHVTKRFHLFLLSKCTGDMRRDVYQGIADPTRRKILTMLAHQPLNVNSVAERFDVSRTAVYKHLKILAECGLIIVKQTGRERFCESRMEKLNEVSDWVTQYKRSWTARL